MGASQDEHGTYAKDDVLVALIKFVERNEHKPDVLMQGQLDIILNIGGMLVCGQLISAFTYSKEFLSEVGADNDESVASEQQHSESRNFIHLRNAKFFVSSDSHIPSVGDGFLWRGRLCAVMGLLLANWKQQKLVFKTQWKR